MRRPGIRVRALAARVCSARVMARVIDPTLADLQAEYEEAHGRRATWQRRWIVVRGYAALVRALCVHAGTHAIAESRALDPHERAALTRTFAAGVVVMLVATLWLAALSFVNAVPPAHPRGPALALLLVPQALPFSIPIGLAFALAWGARRLAAAGCRRLFLAAALAASIVSFATVAWLAPAANQGFRTSVAGTPIPKGTHELSLGELRRLLASGGSDRVAAAPAGVRELTRNYRTRWVLVLAPLVLGLAALALATRRDGSRDAIGS